MKFPLSWIKEYIDVPMSPTEIATRLTMVGIEVDSLEKEEFKFKGVVVGKVLTTEKHPNADKLTLATVTDGMNTYQVVCGAPNCRAGLVTAFAPVGALLFDEKGEEFRIKKTKIRGVESEGMLCAEDELGIGERSEGIIEFDASKELGSDVADILADTIFEISITPNLAHCANVIGLARELAAAIDSCLIPPKFPVLEDAEETTDHAVHVHIHDKEKCPRYCARVIQGIKIGPSPLKIRRRLEACGVRPVNNIVDITNYVLLETGQPLHAFDFDLVAGHEIHVRTAKEGESFVTLDGKKRVLTKADLLICDRDKPVAIGGIMGGLNSEVGNTTVNVLVESAYFEPVAVRKTSKRLGLRTDASWRFERGANPNNAPVALERAISLMKEVAGGHVLAGMVDNKKRTFDKQKVMLRLARASTLLGTPLSISEVESVWKRLGFTYKWDGEGTFIVDVPTYRVDIHEEVDLIEEVARIYGYENLVRHRPRYQTALLPHSPMFVFEKKVKTQLVADGLQEFITCNLIGPSLLDLVDGSETAAGDLVQVMNPKSIEQSILRPSLLPGLLQVLKDNFDHFNQDIQGFEVGRVHFKKENQYVEQLVAGIVLMGKNRPYHFSPKPVEVDFFDLKGIIENLLVELRTTDFQFKKQKLATLHPERQAGIFLGALEVGAFGEVHPSILRKMGIPRRVYFAEVNLHDLLHSLKGTPQMKPLAMYPGSERDWTVTLEDEVPNSQIVSILQYTPSPLLKQFQLLDVYQSEKVGAKKKNVTFRFTYRDDEKTVTQEAVDAEHGRLTKQVLEALGKTKSHN